MTVRYLCRLRGLGWRAFVAGCAVVTGCASGPLDSQQQLISDEARISAAEQRAKDTIVISHGGVAPTLGRFLLVRRGADTCALRFTRFWREGRRIAPTWWTSGEDSAFAEYEWVHQADGSGDVRKPNVMAGRATLSHRPTYGLPVHGLQFRPSAGIARCGPFRLAWNYPDFVGVNAQVSATDDPNELAPTKWTSLSEVDSSDARLRWFRFDLNRARTETTVDKLW